MIVASTLFYLATRICLTADVERLRSVPTLDVLLVELTDSVVVEPIKEEGIEEAVVEIVDPLEEVAVAPNEGPVQVPTSSEVIG